jgi:hypothetical protein
MSAAAELRDIAHRLSELATTIDGEVSPEAFDTVQTVKKVFDGQVRTTLATPEAQREALSQAPRSAPNEQNGLKQQACKYCNLPIYLQQSQRTGNWYTTNSERRNDLHQCEKRPQR